jgi:small subunit ribosomal protein S16
VAVKIRLKRMGKIRAPYYRVVVVDSRKKRDGRVIEEIGKYQPKEEPSLIEVTSERAQYWLGVGAQPSEAVEALLKVTGDWQRFKGLPGAEGSLKVAEQKRDKAEIFNEALKEAGSEPSTEAVTKKTSKKAEKPAEAPAEQPAEQPAAAADEPAVAAGQSPEAATEQAEAEETQAVDAEQGKGDETPEDKA